MSIQSTSDITRNQAIDRIRLVYSLACKKDYRAISDISFETNHNVVRFVQNINTDIDINDIDTFTNEMLEEIIDMPFFRESMFDNYFVTD